MKKEDIRPGMVLRNTRSGKIGVPFTGCDYGCIDYSMEVAMIYQGDDNDPKGAPAFIGTSFENLEPYELKPEDLLTEEHVKDTCKPGTEEVCAYLVAGAGGFDCSKVMSDHSIAMRISDRLREGKMNAKGDNCGGRYNPKSF